jgi:IS30 family transposase
MARGVFSPSGRLIHVRPDGVEERTRIGDWQGDLIVRRSSRSAIGILVDQHTGDPRPVHLPDEHTAEQLRAAMLPVPTELPDLPQQTPTWAQYAEMACHHLLGSYS